VTPRLTKTPAAHAHKARLETTTEDDKRHRSQFAAAKEGCNPADMETPLTAQDLWPLLLKLPHDEQLRLAKLALYAASGGGREDARAYQAAPPAENEFAIADNPLAWEGEGWDKY